MYNANKMNKRVVAFDEFHALSPDEDDFFGVKPGDVKSFGEDQEMKSSSKSSSTRRRVEKKIKVRWTKDLHKKFLEAVGKLGIDKAVPKKIVELMKVDGLTRDHVASHLQKYRILSKKITNASLNNGVQTASKPSLLESSMTNGASWSQSSLMLNQEQMNRPSCGMHPISPLILDTSSSYFPTLDASNFNATKNGYFTQAMTNNLNLEKQRNFVDDTTNSSVVNSVTSSNSGFVQNLETSFFHDYGGCSTEVQIYNNFQKGSSGGVPYSSNPPFVQNPNIFEISNYSSQNEYESVEIGSLYGASSNMNLKNRFSEDDMILSEDDMANLLSFADDYNITVTRDLSKQDMNGHNPPNTVSFYPNYQEHISINHQPTLDAYLPSFEPTFVHMMDEQFVEPVLSPDLLQTIRQFKA